MYMAADGSDQGRRREVPSPDPQAGLYIRSRAGTLVRAVIPPDCLAFQLGQQMQVASGGALRATWHCVQAAQGPAAAGVARNTFAVFMQPTWDAILHAPPGAGPADVDVAEWAPGQTFDEFTNAVLRKYYTNSGGM
jgi:isopenicillin N synthase-like dioxygenase